MKLNLLTQRVGDQIGRHDEIKRGNLYAPASGTDNILN